MRARVLQRALSSTLWGTTHTQMLFINVHVISAHIYRSGGRKKRKLHTTSRVCFMSFSDADSFSLCRLSRSTRYVNKYSSRVRKWSTFLRKKRLFFAVNGKKFCEITRAHARVYIFYTSKALLNAPDENSRTHVRVCVFSTFFFTERILFFSSVESARPSGDGVRKES